MTALRAMRAFAAVVVRAVLRDRTALIFVVVLPVLVIVIIGITFGSGDEVDIGVVRADDDRVARDIEATLGRGDGVELRRYDTVDELRGAVRRHTVGAGLVLPAGMDRAVLAGEEVEVDLFSLPSEPAIAARTALTGAIDRVGGPIAAARVVSAELGGEVSEALGPARQAAADAPVEVRGVDVGASGAAEVNAFSRTAPQNLVLFVFVNALTSGVYLVIMRRDRVLFRVRSTPISMPVVLAGLAGGWFAFTILQSALIVAVGALAFGVEWGDPVAASLLVVAFALVGVGGGLLVGAVGENEDRVTAITPPVGLVLAALGGCMVPLEVFPSAMRTVAKITPHAWAIEAWETLVFDRGGVGDIVANLAVLAAFAVGLLGLASVVLGRRLQRA